MTIQFLDKTKLVNATIAIMNNSENKNAKKKKKKKNQKKKKKKKTLTRELILLNFKNTIFSGNSTIFLQDTQLVRSCMI